MSGPWADGAALKAAILRKADREDLSDRIDEFVRLAEKQIDDDLELRFVETIYTGTFDGTTDLLELPAGAREPIYFWITAPTRVRVDVVSPARFQELQAAQAGEPYPLGVMAEGLGLRFTSAPGDDVTWELKALAELPSLTDSGSNWLLENGPMTLFYAGLMQLATEVEDATAYLAWERLYTASRDRLRRREWRSRAGVGGGSLAPRPRGPTP